MDQLRLMRVPWAKKLSGDNLALNLPPSFPPQNVMFCRLQCLQGYVCVHAIRELGAKFGAAPRLELITCPR